MDGSIVTNQQLYLAIGVPMLFNAVLMGLLLAVMNAKFDGVNGKFEGINAKSDAKFEAVYGRLDALDRRLDELKELWRAELRRVEEVLDARLKHFERR